MLECRIRNLFYFPSQGDSTFVQSSLRWYWLAQAEILSCCSLGVGHGAKGENLKISR